MPCNNFFLASKKLTVSSLKPFSAPHISNDDCLNAEQSIPKMKTGTLLESAIDSSPDTESKSHRQILSYVENLSEQLKNK